MQVIVAVGTESPKLLLVETSVILSISLVVPPHVPSPLVLTQALKYAI
jgi:hypothetical protein